MSQQPQNELKSSAINLMDEQNATLSNLTIIRNELQLHAIQKNLKNMILSKRKQPQKTINGMILSELLQEITVTGKSKEPQRNE